MTRYLLFAILVFLVPCLAGCTPREARDAIRSKHAESAVIEQRLTDNDPANDPTHQQLKDYAVSTAKDWESMDRIFNNWKPKESGGIKAIDLEKADEKINEKPVEVKPAEPTSPKPD